MTVSILTHLPHTDGSLVELSLTLPGHLLATQRLDTAREVLGRFSQLAGAGVLPASLKKKNAPPDALGNLWFLQTAYAAHRVLGDDLLWRETLLPLLKRIVQGVVTGLFPDTRMNDGGLLLTTGKGADAASLVRNALWYNALGILAEELRKVGDHTGDHFDRLAGRFRRSFLKSFWCEPHQSFCAPEARQREDHAPPPTPPTPLPMLHPDQLLLMILPVSAIPRTKQRQIVDTIRQNQRAPLGVRLTLPAKGKAAPTLVESPLYLAWLAEAHMLSSDAPAAIGEALTWLTPAHQLLGDEGQGQLARYYHDQTVAKVPGNVPAHGPTMAEVHRVWLALQKASPVKTL